MEKIGQYASRAGFEGYASILFQTLGGCVMSRSGERSVRIREVKGSNPSRSTTKKSREIADFTAFFVFLGVSSFFLKNAVMLPSPADHSHPSDTQKK